MKPFPAALFAFLLLTSNLAIAADQPYELKGEAPGSRRRVKSEHR
jgi:hypothetical protein